jgi:hypothetical protein
MKKCILCEHNLKVKITTTKILKKSPHKQLETTKQETSSIILEIFVRWFYYFSYLPYFTIESY